MLSEQANFNCMYRAKVVSNKDPKEICRIKVRVPCIHGTDSKDGLGDDDLPFAMPCMMDVSFESGTFIIPEVGSTVFVFFEGGKVDKPVYIGGSCSYEHDEAQEYGSKDSNSFSSSEGKRTKRAYMSDPPINVYKGGVFRKFILFKTRKGSSIEFSDEDDKEHLSIYDRIGQAFTMYSPVSTDENADGMANRGVFSLLKDKFDVKKKAILILKSLSSSFLRFVSEVSYTKNEFTTVFKEDKAGISVDIGKDNRILIFYKDKTLIEIKEDKICIKTDKIDIDGDVNIKGDLKVQGQVLSSSTIRGDVYGTWVHSNAQYPVSLNLDVNINPYVDDEDEQIIEE